MALRIVTDSYHTFSMVTLHKGVIRDKFDVQEQICLCSPLFKTEQLLKSEANSQLVAVADIQCQWKTRKNTLFKSYFMKYCHTYQNITVSVL